MLRIAFYISGFACEQILLLHEAEYDPNYSRIGSSPLPQHRNDYIYSHRERRMSSGKYCFSSYSSYQSKSVKNTLRFHREHTPCGWKFVSISIVIPVSSLRSERKSVLFASANGKCCSFIHCMNRFAGGRLSFRFEASRCTRSRSVKTTPV